MGTILTTLEKKDLEIFIRSVDKPIISVKYSYLYSGAISVIGLILLVSAVIISLNNFNNKTAYWVLLPGMLGGIVTILLGIFVFRYFRKYEQTKRIIGIIKKMMD